MVAVAVFGLGCSQTPAPADGGSSDAAPATDAPASGDGAVSCSLPEYEAGGTLPECILTAQYVCGPDVYEIDCSCPTGECTCFKDGAKIKSVPYGACPSCSSTSFDDSGCGFPVDVAH